MKSPTTVVKQAANLQQIRLKKRYLKLFAGKPTNASATIQSDEGTLRTLKAGVRMLRWELR